MTPTSVEIFDIVINEPSTAITDFIITILCLVLCSTITKKEYKEKSTKHWYFFFMLMGVSTFFGGLSHGLSFYLSDVQHKAVWIMAQVMSGFALYFAQLATVESIFKNTNVRKILVLIVSLELLAFILVITFYQNFLVVKLNTAIVFIPMLIANLITYKNGRRHAGWIASAILILILTAFVHGAKISVSSWFNHNDISHVLISLSLYCFFLGVSLNEELLQQESGENLQKIPEYMENN